MRDRAGLLSTVVEWEIVLDTLALWMEVLYVSTSSFTQWVFFKFLLCTRKWTRYRKYKMVWHKDLSSRSSYGWLLLQCGKSYDAYLNRAPNLTGWLFQLCVPTVTGLHLVSFLLISPILKSSLLLTFSSSFLSFSKWLSVRYQPRICSSSVRLPGSHSENMMQ